MDDVSGLSACPRLCTLSFSMLRGTGQWEGGSDRARYQSFVDRTLPFCPLHPASCPAASLCCSLLHLHHPLSL